MITRCYQRSGGALALVFLVGCGGGASADTPDGGPAPHFATAAGVGKPYGARDPRTCPDRKEPKRGAPSPAQAAAYVVCHSEHEFGSSLYLVDDVRVTDVAKGRAYNPIEDRNMPNVDVEAPVYAIRGALTSIACDHESTILENVGHNCRAESQPQAHGLCYKDTFGDWSCSMVDIDGTGKRDKLAPPKA